MKESTKKKILDFVRKDIVKTTLKCSILLCNPIEARNMNSEERLKDSSKEP